MASDEARKKKQARTNKYRSANRVAYNEYIREYRKAKTAGKTPKPLSFFVAKHGEETSPTAKRKKQTKTRLKNLGLVKGAVELLETAGANPLPEKGTASPMREQSLTNKVYMIEEREGRHFVVIAPSGTPDEVKMDFRSAADEANKLNKKDG